jgi:hypothetical protein
MNMSKLTNNVWWSLVGWILVLAGLMLYVQGYKPIIFGIGIFVVFYRVVIEYTDKYESKTNY